MSWDSARAKALDNGMCGWCRKNPHRPNRILCEDCSKKNSERQAARIDKRGRKTARRCGVCRDSGHFRQRCPQKKWTGAK